MFRKLFKNFTLIKAMIIVAIIGVLATMFVSKCRDYLN